MKNTIIFRSLKIVIVSVLSIFIGLISCSVNDDEPLSLKAVGNQTYKKFLLLMKAPIAEDACGYFHINVDSSMEQSDDFDKLALLNLKYYDIEKKVEVKGTLSNTLLNKKILAVFSRKSNQGSGIFNINLEYHKNKRTLLAYHYTDFSIDNKYKLSGAIYFENGNISEQNTNTMQGIFKINGSLNLYSDGIYQATLEIKNLLINNSNGRCGSIDSVDKSSNAENLIILTYKYRILNYKSVANSKTIQITPNNDYQEMFPLLLS